LLEAFCQSYLKLYKKSGLSLVKDIYDGFEPALTEYGVGTIAEIYDGDPPHAAKGAISQAWSVAALLKIASMIELWEKEN
jgi:glycogen debranching enzyme